MTADGRQMTPTPTIAARLYILCGLPFAGKSTLATTLARRFGWVIISIDAINHARGLGLNGEPMTLEQWDETYAEAYHRLSEALVAQQTVIFDAVSYTRAQRDELRAIATERGASTRVIYLDIPADVCRGRWLANRATEARYDVRDEDFEHVVRRFEPPYALEKPLVCDHAEAAHVWIERTFGESTRNH